MPTIRPSSSLRNSYNEISEFCHKYNEPVFITKNGEGDLAVMSIDSYEKLTGRFELYRLLGEGIEDIREGRTAEAKDAFKSIRESTGL